MPNRGTVAGQASHDRSTPGLRGAPAELSTVVVDDPSGGRVVVVSGEIDIGNFERFRAAVDSALVERSQLSLDLSGVTFIDSAGIAVLARLAAVDADVHLRNPSQPVRRVIEVTGLANVLRLIP